MVCTGTFVIRVMDFADHEEGQDEDAYHRQPVPDPGTREDVGCHDDTGHRAGKPFEVPMDTGDLHVEPGQPEGAEGTEKGTGNEADGAQFMELVGIHEGTGSDAEGNIIGKGIQFYSHGTSGMQGPGHTAIQGVCHHGDQDKYSSGFKISGYGHHNRQPAEERIRRGHCICYP